MTNRLGNPEIAERLRGKILTSLSLLIFGALVLFWIVGATFAADEASAQSSHGAPSTGFAARVEAAIR